VSGNPGAWFLARHGDGSLLLRVELRTVARQPAPFEALQLFRKRNLDGLASTRKALGLHEAVDALDEPALDCHGDFGFRHGTSYSPSSKLLGAPWRALLDRALPSHRLVSPGQCRT
jgi:hypothetical protein